MGNIKNPKKEWEVRCRWCRKKRPMFWATEGGFCNYDCYESFKREELWRLKHGRK